VAVGLRHLGQARLLREPDRRRPPDPEPRDRRDRELRRHAQPAGERRGVRGGDDREDHGVAVAWGDGVTLPCWTTELKETVAFTNPVWLDADGDGRCDSPRALAQALLDHDSEHGEGQIPALAAAIETVDDAVAFQMLDLLRESLGSVGADAIAQIATATDPQHPTLAT